MKCRLCGYEFRIGEMLLTHFLQNHAVDLDELRSFGRFMESVYKYFIIEKE